MNLEHKDERGLDLGFIYMSEDVCVVVAVMRGSNNSPYLDTNQTQTLCKGLGVAPAKDYQGHDGADVGRRK